MYRVFNLMLITGIIVLVPIALVHGAKQQSASETALFLEQAAEGQKMEMTLGLMATRKAADEEVKEFGSRMATDHKKAILEIRTLVLREGLELHAQPIEQHKQLTARLSQLSGKEFDRVYIISMLHEHKKNVKNFEQQSLAGENTEVRQWAASALPVFKEHLDRVKTIASSLGMKATATPHTAHK